MTHTASVPSGRFSNPSAAARRRPSVLLAMLLLCPSLASAGFPSELAGPKALYPSLDSLLIDLHKHPELSLHEEETSAKLASRLRDFGFEVTEHVGIYGRVAGVPSVQLWIGAVEPGAFATARATGTILPAPHSPLFAPDREPSITTGASAFTLSALELLGQPAGGK